MTYRVTKFSQTRKKPKYHNTATATGGLKYHSKLESKYAQDLEFRKRAHDIRDWARQVKIELNFRFSDVENGWVLTDEPLVKLISQNILCKHLANYYIDFVVYHNDDSVEYVEVKGMELEVWKQKFFLTELILHGKPETRLTVVK